jgi:hypothetical protein
MLEAPRPEPPDHRLEFRLARRGTRLDALAGQFGDRETQPTAPAIGLEGAQPVGEAHGQPDLAPDLERRRIGRPEDQQGGLNDRRRAALELPLQRFEIGGRRILELALARVDRRVQAGADAGSCAQDAADRLRDRLRRRPAARGRVERVPPPLQPDQARDRLTDQVADLADLVVEGVEREQRLARRSGREQGREIAVLSGVPDQLGAIGKLGAQASTTRSSGASTPATGRAGRGSRGAAAR